jgi:ABC-2 type transport system ATP-binding protein
VGLEDQRQQRIGTLSTGQRQKMNFARGLLNDPWIFFLDEPTLGLDVSAARAVRELILEWRAAVPGRTVLLTTHYMAEADEMCERLAIVDRGKVLAIGSPAELKRRVQTESIIRLELDRLDGGPAVLARLPGVVSAVAGTATAPEGGEVSQTVAINLALVEPAALGGVVGALAGLGSRIVSLRTAEPSLEDVFIELVGRGFDDTDGDGGAEPPDRPQRPARLADGDADPRPAGAPHETTEPEPEEVAS